MQMGNSEEFVVGGCDVEVDGIEGLFSCQFLFNESLDVFNVGCDSLCEFVYVVSIGVVVDCGVNDEGVGVFVIFGFFDLFGYFG